MNCKKCGRPMGKKGYCTVCSRPAEKGAKQGIPRSFWIILAVALTLIIVATVIILVINGRSDGGESKPSSITSVRVDTDKDASGQTVRTFDEATLFGAEGSYDPTTITGTYRVEIEVEGFGTIPLELDADAAPITVANFLNLVEAGFYDGLTFHRIQEGFMMQGGDPLGTGIGGSDDKITGEFSSNGFVNTISHTEGTISMARSPANDSASSQFFICHGDCTFLDGDYAAFGRVVEDGMDIVNDICAYASTCERDQSSYVFRDAADQPVIVAIRIAE